jgi:hypothetical protein
MLKDKFESEKKPSRNTSEDNKQDYKMEFKDSEDHKE